MSGPLSLRGTVDPGPQIPQTYARLQELARIARIDVLVIDDWGLAPVAERERHDLLEIMEDRDGQR